MFVVVDDVTFFIASSLLPSCEASLYFQEDGDDEEDDEASCVCWLIYFLLKNRF